ncbi:MAG TPA: hypothetical protein VJH65_01585 [Candidatus Nanoarchaeia archaeon]|nr:hypothetical protein [Candidatus Nanoarchaeia archaeon]
MAENPTTKRIISYLIKNLSKGYTEESLRFALISQGYSRTVIDRAILQVHKELAEKAPLLREKPTIVHEIINENDKAITIKKPWWKRLFGI